MRLGFGAADLVIVAGAGGDAADRRKGLGTLLGTAPELQRRFSGRVVRLVLFGPGRAEVRRSGGTVVQAVGPVGKDEELAWLYSAADVVVVPSIQDNLPNVAVESVACGTPVVGFASGGLPEIVAGPASGAIAPELTWESLVEAISRVVDYRRRRASAAIECARIAAATYGPEEIASRHVRLYSELMDAPGTTAGVALPRGI